MLESEHRCRGLCKTDSEVSRKECVTNCSRILQTCSGRRTDPKTFRNRKSRTFSAVAATSRSEYFTVKRIGKKLFLFIYYNLMAAYKIQKHNKKKKSAITYLLFILALAKRLISWLMPEIPKLDQPSCPLKRRNTTESEDIIITLLWQFQTQSKIWCTVQIGGPWF